MNTNTAFLNLLSNELFGITSPIRRKKRNKRSFHKKYPFVILNTDTDYGFYVQRLLKEVRKYPLLYQQHPINTLRAIKTNDFIIFGDSNSFDYRIEVNVESVRGFNSHSWKVYDLVQDFTRIVKRLVKYVQNNQLSRYCYEGENSLDLTDYISSECRVSSLPFPKRAKSRKWNPWFQEQEDDIVININISEEEQRPIKKKHSLRRNILSCFTDDSFEKTTVHDNWVKIGYNQYDIYYDGCDNEYITVNNETFYIKENRFGRRYLTS